MLITNSDKLDDIVSSDLSAMNDFVFKNVNDEDAKLATDIISHLVRSGGKKIRPKLVFIICKMLNYSGENRINVAASVGLYTMLLYFMMMCSMKVRHAMELKQRIRFGEINQAF